MNVHVFDRLGELTILQGFLEAKLWMAICEWDKIGTLACRHEHPWLDGRLKYARHQISVLKQLIRDAANPERSIKRWLDALAKEAGTVDTTVSARSAKISSRP